MEKQGHQKITIFFFYYYFTMDGGACVEGKQVDESLDKIKLKTRPLDFKNIF